MTMITVLDPNVGMENGWIKDNKTESIPDAPSQQLNGHINNGFQGQHSEQVKQQPVITQQPILDPLSSFKQTVVTENIGPVLGPFPTPVKCPHCFTHSISETVLTSGLATYLLAGGCCCFGLWCCCCCVFCLDSCKDVHHYCPNCKVFLGRYKKIG